MASKESRSPAHPEPPRQRLTSPWTLLGILVAVSVTLVLIFPGYRGSLVQQGPVTKERPEDVSLTYLAKLAKEQPGNPELRFQYAQKEQEVGKTKAARAALEPLYNHADPAVRQRARLQDFKLQMQEMTALPPNSAERKREMERLRQELVGMSQYEWPTTGLLELATLANQLGARKLRSDIYLRIARSDEKQERKWVDEAGAAALADGEYRTASDIFFIAMNRAQTREDRKHYFMKGVAALQAGNMPREALNAAERNAGDLLRDDDMLRYMIRLAQASNEPQRAQQYVRRLMRMSEQGAFTRFLARIADVLVPSAHAAQGPQAAPPPSPPNVMRGMRPFNNDDYKLAYDVFLSNKNLNDAYRVAAAAVHQAPNDFAWRERLAQVSEWSNRYPESLQQWMYIARRTNRPEAWQAVLRLAPGLNDDEALLEAMRHQADRAPLTEGQVRALADAYERVGRSREAADILQREYQRSGRPGILERRASLLERMGDLDGSIAAYRELIQRTGATKDRVMTLATLLMLRGSYKDAYDLLAGYQSYMSAEEDNYWRMLSNLAREMQDDATQQRALNVLVSSSKVQPDDLNRLIQLLLPQYPEAGARLAEWGYDRFRTTDYLILALGVYSNRRDWIGMQRVFAKLTPEVEAQLVATSPDFLMLRGQYRNAIGQPEIARLDYEEALRIDPEHKLARLGYIWHLIDNRDLERLKRQMQIVVTRARTDPDFEGAAGAAFVILQDPRTALGYFQKILKRNPDDYLWLLNYADALEQANEPDMAWRVRRHAWLKVREEKAKVPEGENPSLVLLRAEARLAITFEPGDRVSAVMRHLLRQDNALAPDPQDPLRRTLDNGVRDIALAWAISGEMYEPAKAWLTRQYAKNVVKPTWAESLLAVVEKDVETMQRLLDTKMDDVPRYDRHEAAYQTQQYKLAEDIAFTELEKRPHDDEMHLRLTNSVLATHNYWEAGYTRFRRGAISGNEYTAETGIWLSPRLRLSFDVTHIDMGLNSPGVFGTIPGDDTAYGVTALFRHAIGETRLSVFHRDALAEVTGFRIVHARPLGARLYGRIGLAYNDRALETSATTVGAVRDRAFVNVRYQPSKREWIMGELQASRYYTQTERTFIGSGHSLMWETGHRFRTEYPDLHVRAQGSFNHYNLSGSGDASSSMLTPDGTIPTSSFYLPGSFSVYGIYTGFGTFYRETYTRAIRPFVDVGISHNTVTGMGYGAILGASGSVFGADKLTLYASQGRGGTGTNELVREVGVKYMYMFDRF
ncbi:MAG TPA: tetratricopeptide repeat protein [Burkholderiales bacterium]|nr:tetratricopeptide repeat protein [Burkholderiales bacterium]